MAQPTTSQHPPAAQQAPTHGVATTAREGAHADAPRGADPMLPEEPDMVMLLRLYPHAKSHDELKRLALEAGRAVQEAGAKLIASQQEPIAEASTR